MIHGHFFKVECGCVTDCTGRNAGPLWKDDVGVHTRHLHRHSAIPPRSWRRNRHDKPQARTETTLSYALSCFEINSAKSRIVVTVGLLLNDAGAGSRPQSVPK